MANDYYDDGGGGGEDDGSATPEQQDARRDNERTTLIPSSLCPGMDVGDEVTLRIVGVHEDEYEVAYQPSKKGEDESESEPSMARASADNNGVSDNGMSGYMED